jgi:hypothetical protein
VEGRRRDPVCAAETRTVKVSNRVSNARNVTHGGRATTRYGPAYRGDYHMMVLENMTHAAVFRS